MINAAPPPTTNISPPPPSSGARQTSAFYTQNANQTVNSSRLPPQHSKTVTKLLTGALLLLVLVVGSAVGLYLLNQNQDFRQQASQSIPSTIKSLVNGAFCPDPPVVTNRTAVWTLNNTQAKIDWTLQSGAPIDFEIWNISNGILDPQNPKTYYLQNLSSLPANARTFTTTNISTLLTRRFLIKAITKRDDQGDTVCSDEWALCINPVVHNRTVISTGTNNYQFAWEPIQAPLVKYEIWLIAEGDLDPSNPNAYYLAKLADNISPTATNYTLTMPEQYQGRSAYRFLIRAINWMDNSNPSCYDQWALSPQVAPSPTPTTNRCTLSFTIIRPTASPTNVPNATATPVPTRTPTPLPGATATPVPSIGCNQNCITNADCSNPNHICFTDSSGVNRCRLETNPQNASCQAAVAQAPTQPPVVLPEQLPVSGPEDWTTWLKAGLAILGMGAALLLML